MQINCRKINLNLDWQERKEEREWIHVFELKEQVEALFVLNLIMNGNREGLTIWKKILFRTWKVIQNSFVIWSDLGYKIK